MIDLENLVSNLKTVGTYVRSKRKTGMARKRYLLASKQLQMCLRVANKVSVFLSNANYFFFFLPNLSNPHHVHSLYGPQIAMPNQVIDTNANIELEVMAKVSPAAKVSQGEALEWSNLDFKVGTKSILCQTWGHIPPKSE